MIKSIIVPAIFVALEKLGEIVKNNEKKGRSTVIFCEDRLTLAAERTVCSAVGGTFDTSVYTLSRFLSSELGKRANVLSSQGSAMAIRRIIEENRDELKLFGKFSASASAGAVYDTIALLYSSKISAEELGKARAGGLLESKLGDISLIYSLYDGYLAENGKIDANAYLAEVPSVISRSEKIRGSDVVFLGFQSFTRSSAECVRAAFGSASNVYGLFIGGKEEIYVNEGSAVFESVAEEFGGAEYERITSGIDGDADALRRGLYNPDSYYGAGRPTYKVRIFEASDEDEEMEFVCACIKKHVTDDGIRYGKISVMLPDVADAERRIERIFSEYRIPYYADRRHVLSEHPVCEFIINMLVCALAGCALKDVDAVVASPLFDANRDDKDAYRNYALRLADFRGGVKREPDREILGAMNFNYDAVQRVRARFLKELEYIEKAVHTKKLDGVNAVKAVHPREITAAVKRLLLECGAEDRLNALKEKFADSFPTASAFSGRVYGEAVSVIEEAENVLGGEYIPLNEYIKILKSGFAATEISLIPPKADAVFVGDIASTANTGSEIIFACSLTYGVPKTSADTSLLTDGEIEELERADLGISPKIRQVNMRRRETAALNVCAFSGALYLIYPVRQGGEETGASEIISYASAIFSGKSGGLKPIEISRFAKARLLPYYCSERLPALKALGGELSNAKRAAVRKVLSENGYGSEVDAKAADNTSVSCGRELFVTYDCVSPTALETYYSCPYRNFMQQGLKLQEREEGAMRPLDTGNFIHTVLQNIAPEISGCPDADGARARATAEAERLLGGKAYSALTGSKRGQYTAAELIKEAGDVAAGMYEQIANSKFKIENTEWRCEIEIGGGVRVNGRIDRVDAFGDMVRIIDYKTGTIDASATKYYMGQKLQLPLYLCSASAGRRAVGAYYFPASVEYKPKADGVFRLQGFMDGSDEVVSASDTGLQPKQKSAYFDAYLGGKSLDSAMDSETFADFLSYSLLIAGRGAREMLDGNIGPSPAEDACKYCKMGGSCNFAAGIDGEERSSRTVKCADVARIVRKYKGGE